MQQMQQMNFMMSPNPMNFMYNMNNQQIHEKQKLQNQAFYYFPYPNMNNNMPNQYNQFNNMGNKNYDINYNTTPNTDQMNNKNVENKIMNNNLLNSDKKMIMTKN